MSRTRIDQISILTQGAQKAGILYLLFSTGNGFLMHAIGAPCFLQQCFAICLLVCEQKRASIPHARLTSGLPRKFLPGIYVGELPPSR